MKGNKKKYTILQKFMIVFIPVIVLLLIASIVMSIALAFLPLHTRAVLNAGNATLIMALCSTVLAVVCIIIAIFNSGKDEEEDG